MPGARAWTACAGTGTGKVIALCVVANAPARHDRRENSRAEIRSVSRPRVSLRAESAARDVASITSPRARRADAASAELTAAEIPRGRTRVTLTDRARHPSSD